MKKYSIYIILLIVTLSCKTSTKTDGHNFLKNIKDRDNHYIPDSIVSFFPDNSKQYNDLTECFTAVSTIESKMLQKNSMFFPSYIVKIYQCGTQSTYDDLINEYKKKYINKITAEQENYFIVDRDIYLFEEYDSLYLKNIYKTKSPIILNFHKIFDDMSMPNIYDTTTICGLSERYNILTLKSGNKYILPNECFFEWDILPNELKHGYRSGVAFKENELYIIYWAVTW